MKRAFQVLAGLLAVEVVVQAMAIAYGLAGLSHWVDKDGGVLNKAALDDAENLHFRGVGGFAIHGINGMNLIPLIAIALLVVSFFAKVEGGVRRAGILFGMVALQVILGLSASGEPLLAPLHALNGFGIFVMAAMTARSIGIAPVTPAEERVAA